MIKPPLNNRQYNINEHRLFTIIRKTFTDTTDTSFYKPERTSFKIVKGTVDSLLETQEPYSTDYLYRNKLTLGTRYYTSELFH